MFELGKESNGVAPLFPPDEDRQALAKRLGKVISVQTVQLAGTNSDKRLVIRVNREKGYTQDTFRIQGGAVIGVDSFESDGPLQRAE